MAATGLASGDEASPNLAAAAVHQALERAGCDCASGILLYLTADFSRNAQAAVSAATRAGHCLQVAGATFPGVFTESDWIIDRPGAAALVLCGDLSLMLPRPGATLISLARPDVAGPAWLATEEARCGGLSADGATLRPGKLWQHGKVAEDGTCTVTVAGARSRTDVSRGLRLLSAPRPGESEGYELRRVGDRPALESLLRELPLEMRDRDNLPLHLLQAGVLEGAAEHDAEAVAAGRYTLLPLLQVNGETGAVALPRPLAPGARVVWLLRQPLGAEQDMRAMLERLAPAGAPDPAFALMFSCMGRGPYFYGGSDRDLDLVRGRWPTLPLLGAYCAGEVAPLPEGNAVIHNSVVLTLFEADDVQPQP